MWEGEGMVMTIMAYDCPLSCGASFQELEQINPHIEEMHKDEALKFNKLVQRLLYGIEFIPIPYSNLSWEELKSLKFAILDADSQMCLIPLMEKDAHVEQTEFFRFKH